jgi:hypothetical protein
MLAILTSKLGLAGIAIALVLGIIGVQTLRLAGAKHELAVLKAADAKIAADVKAHEATAATISQAAQTQVATERVRVQTVTRTLVQKVPVYVPAAADTECVVPVGFVQLHDLAATGVSVPAGGPVEAASGVQLSSVLATVVGNYGVAYDWRAEALGWRAWYVDQKAAWERN